MNSQFVHQIPICAEFPLFRRNKAIYREILFDDYRSLRDIHHQYDIGSKLTENEEIYLKELKVDDIKDDVYGSMTENVTTIKLREILKSKLLKSQQITNHHRSTKNNKFSSNLYQNKYFCI